jgi:hypothetical protein
MNLILQQDTIKDVMLFYNFAETNIHNNLIHILTKTNNKFDILIDEILEDLKIKDKDWGKSGTIRVHKDKYQTYLRNKAIPMLEKEIATYTKVIIEYEH